MGLSYFKEPFDDAGHIMDLVSKFESRTLSEEQRVMRLQAIEMGFDVALVDRAFLTTDFMGVNRSYESITDLLEQLVLLQSEDRFDPEPLGAFDATSDDFRINAWLTEADNMGFPQNLVLNALAAAEGGFTSLESLLDRVMELQVEEDARGRTVAAEHSNEKGKLEEMRKENDALRDYFSCKICFSAYSVVAFWPCGHLCCCAVCGSQQESLCPVCRQGVSQKRSRITETKIDSPLPGWEDRKPELPDEMKLLDFENQLMKSVRQCKLCKKEDRMVYFLPCNHVVSCGLCSKSVVWCPCCGVLVTEKLTVYIV